MTVASLKTAKQSTPWRVSKLLAPGITRSKIVILRKYNTINQLLTCRIPRFETMVFSTSSFGSRVFEKAWYSRFRRYGVKSGMH